MLTRLCLCSMVSSAIILLANLLACPPAFADEAAKMNVRLSLDPSPDDYSYRKINDKKTISIMLYGFRDQPDMPVIQKSRQSLKTFFKQHLDRIKEDVFSNDPNSLKFITGERDFNSNEINRGIGLVPAKMVGFTAPYGHLTLGGGYTWGEKNPAMMRLTKAEGFFTGASYDTGKVGYQLSYLKSGDSVAGFRIGGSKIAYSSLMLGTSFKVTDRMGLTATLQFRNDEDPLTTGEKQTIFTVGTKWKF